MDYLLLHSEQCLSCETLLGKNPKRLKRCHYSKGNIECPAIDITFVIIDIYTKTAHALHKARILGNIDDELAILNKLKTKNKGFRQKVSEQLAKLT